MVQTLSLLWDSCARNAGFRLCTKCRVQKDWWVVWGSFLLTTIHLPHICLMSRRLLSRSAKYDVTHLKKTRNTPEAHKYGPPRAPGDWILNTGSFVWNWLYVTLLTHRILWWLSDFWTTCAPLLTTLAKKMAASKLSRNWTEVKGPQIS